MIDRRLLLSDLQGVLRTLEADLLERSESNDVRDVGLLLRSEYEQAKQAERTALGFDEWRSDSITQVAAAWVLSGVFVRFLEDNRLVDPPKLAGPGERLARARDEHELYFRAHPAHTDRDYLLAVFDGLAKLPAVGELFGRHNPVRDLPNWLSGDAAGQLLHFFQRIDPNTGALVHDFTDPGWDTRFLGDLYQDLSEAARKKYALLQTPVFVEEFILDRTLDPALEEFGLAKAGYETRLEPDGRLRPEDRFRMIDPACGSGHFLLGSFERLLDRWQKKEPGTRTSVLVQRALDSVHGVDLNPYAVAIARFRLLLAALRGCGLTRLKDAPGFRSHVACGDSLLHGSPGGEQLSLGWSAIDHVYQPEDREALERLLRPKTYHAVVANPPYITPKDAALNAAYRERYSTCHRQYSFAVPFLERIFSLAVDGGFTGQITANSFMKREFGKKLIEEFLPTIDLTHIIDTSGAYIPGHATPTVILFGRSRRPVSSVVRAVLGIRGEPSTPDNPAEGLVWRSIVDLADSSQAQNAFISVADMPRATFGTHPWSIGGGGAAELKQIIEDAPSVPLRECLADIGRTTHTGEDDAFYLPASAMKTKGLLGQAVSLITGDDVRDWTATHELLTLFPYDQTTGEPVDVSSSRWLEHFWPLRTTLKHRTDFGNYIEDRGLRWFDHSMFFPARYRNRFSITFAFVATHNHFSFDRGRSVFNRHAPTLKLPSDAMEDDHLALLGLLNSSTGSFWMKQVCQDKGNGGIGGGIGDEAWERRFEHDGTKIKAFPVSDRRTESLSLSREIDTLAREVIRLSPAEFVKLEAPTAERLEANRRETERIQARMVALQEELDWLCYRLYGLMEPAETPDGGYDEPYRDPPGLRLGQRAFEIAMARQVATGDLQTSWFERHGATPITEIPEHWPDSYRTLVARRVNDFRDNPNIALIERPEYKRRWLREPWNDQVARALRSWLLDRLESYFGFDGRLNERDGRRPVATLPVALVSVGRLADVARQDGAFHAVAELYLDDPAFDVLRLVTELVEAESVPLLPVLRYKPSGLRKREEWEATWDLQRLADAVDSRTGLPKDHPDHLTETDAQELKKNQVGTIPVPPKYASADFLKGEYWRLRGKLDVAKERWLSFPHCGGDDDTLLVAWAGYDHLQLARAISAYYVDVQERLGGRDDPRLVPLLACVLELLPWLKQWHNDVDPEFGLPMGDYFEGFLQEESRNLGLTADEIRAWQPPQRASRGRRRNGG
jgi:hypothetical protein